LGPESGETEMMVLEWRSCREEIKGKQEIGSTKQLKEKGKRAQKKRGYEKR